MRFGMACLAVRNRPWWKISDIELRHSKKKSYTRDTIKDLRRLYPKDELYWIIGADSLVLMPRQWRGGYDVLNLCTFVVAPRRGYPLRKVPNPVLKKVIILKRTKYSDVSSTKIRELLKSGRNIPAGLVAKSVKDFITCNHLYR